MTTVDQGLKPKYTMVCGVLIRLLSEQSELEWLPGDDWLPITETG